jgi:hypothetical protein
MKTHVLLAALLAMVAISGCVSEDDAQDQLDNLRDEGGFDEDGNVTQSFGPHSGLALERPASWTPRLDAPPEWVQGEWWIFDLESQLEAGSWSNTRIVAGKQGPDYLLGMPINEFSDDIMVMHIPGFGLVNAENLGFEAHDVMFNFMEFPLEEGNSWTGDFEADGATLGFTVESIEGNLANIAITGAFDGSAVYDAEMGAVTYLELLGYAKYEVTGHGFGYEGIVRVPHSHDLIFFHGRLAQAQGLEPGSGFVNPNPKAQQDIITIPEGYDRVSFGLLFQDLAFGTLQTEAGAPETIGSGVYQIDVTAPDGETYTSQKLPTDGSAFKATMFANDNPTGDWIVDYVALGAGASFIEGIGYVTFDVVLPEGCVLLTSDVHNHGGDCGGHIHDIE